MNLTKHELKRIDDGTFTFALASTGTAIVAELRATRSRLARLENKLFIRDGGAPVNLRPDLRRKFERMKRT